MENRSIQKFQFNIFSAEEIIGHSVAEIKESKTLFGEGCVYDERLGPVDNNKICTTCKQGYLQCTGHFGHILLQEPILHPMLLDEIINFLRVLCIDCHKPILSTEHLKLMRCHQKKGIKKDKFFNFHRVSWEFTQGH